VQFNNEETKSSDSTEAEDKNSKLHLFTDTKFQLLRQCQQEIFEATESSPSIRKIINQLITEENLQRIKSQFIAVWNK
jgi:hypothetical protein